jgi:DNA-binding IclR family transcriptional regulator
MVKIIYAIDSIHRNMPSGNGVQAVRTTFRILHALHDMEGSAGVSELSRELDLPVSTVHSHLTTLHECEYVVKRDTKYDIGYRFLETGGRRRSRSRLYQFAKPKVDQLAAELGDKVNLVVYDHGLAAHLYIAEGEEAIGTDTHTGIRIHAHSSASGKVILAHLPDELVSETLDRREPVRHGPNAITSRDELHEEFERIREAGIAFDHEERIKGLRCVAAPILRDDALPAAISVSGPRSRMNGERFTETIPERLKDVADTLRIKLRYA